jgi:hypothetical protein
MPSSTRIARRQPTLARISPTSFRPPHRRTRRTLDPAGTGPPPSPPVRHPLHRHHRQQRQDHHQGAYSRHPLLHLYHLYHPGQSQQPYRHPAHHPVRAKGCAIRRHRNGRQSPERDRGLLPLYPADPRHHHQCRQGPPRRFRRPRRREEREGGIVRFSPQRAGARDRTTHPRATAAPPSSSATPPISPK